MKTENKHPKGCDYTPFAQMVIGYLENQALNGIAGTWEIAANVFPEKWARPQGRGAMIGHIDRLTTRYPETFGRITPKNQWDDASLFML